MITKLKKAEDLGKRLFLETEPELAKRQIALEVLNKLLLLLKDGETKWESRYQGGWRYHEHWHAASLGSVEIALRKGRTFYRMSRPYEITISERKDSIPIVKKINFVPPRFIFYDLSNGRIWFFAENAYELPVFNKLPLPLIFKLFHPEKVKILNDQNLEARKLWVKDFTPLLRCLAWDWFE